MGAFMWLELTPKGRNELGGVKSWVKLNDEYETGTNTKGLLARLGRLGPISGETWEPETAWPG
jgi:hypothetical protein